MSITEAQPRLPLPSKSIDAGLWRVLTEVTFPAARDAKMIMLAMEYCRVRNLDILKKPINIVPMWSSEQGRYIETIWAGIGETQITAARSKQWAGLDAPRYGDELTKDFEGQRKGKGGWEHVKLTLVFPEWCEVTVYRIVDSVRCAFTERVHWLESYGRQGAGVLPNAMWTKRPYDQVAKVAKAAALRAAFPEEAGAQPTAEEMGGLTVEDANVVQYEPPHKKLAPLQSPATFKQNPATYAEDIKRDLNRAPIERQETPHNPETGEVIDKAQRTLRVSHDEGEGWQDWGRRVIALVREQTELAEVEAIEADNATELDALKQDNLKMYNGLNRSITQHKLSLMPKDDVGPLQ